jgi:hypothetical protein
METGVSAALVDRVKRMLIEPKSEWPRIDAEPATVAGIFKGWVAILAAIPAVAGLIGSLIFGYRVLGFVYRPSIGEALGNAISQYVLAFVSVFVFSLIVDALAPSFGGTKNTIQATKVAAYSMTAAWVAGVLGLIPQLALIGALVGAGYSIYLLYLGLPLLMKAATDKAVAYTVTAIVAAIVLNLIVYALATTITSSFAPRAPLPSVEAYQGQ